MILVYISYLMALIVFFSSIWSHSQCVCVGTSVFTLSCLYVGTSGFTPGCAYAVASGLTPSCVK